MRQLLYDALTADSILNSLGITDDSSFAVDVDTPVNRPFLQLRWGRNDQALSKTQIGRRTLTVWVHDEPGDYTRIDLIVQRVRDILLPMAGQSNGFGHVIAVEWSGDSEDLTDDGHKTIARNTSFSLVGTGQ